MFESIACLAMAIYFESRGEPMVGQVAVAQVVMNRYYDTRFPNDVCDVVKEGYYYSWDNTKPIRNKCQFSFWCDGKPEYVDDYVAWGFALDVAEASMAGYLYDTTNGATHYHAYYVNPSWAKRFTRTVRINDHIFYRWEFE
jgi:N-acetylmuramoyl-L-alanine amidase